MTDLLQRLQRVSVGPRGEGEAMAVVVVGAVDTLLVAVADHMLKTAGNSQHPLSRRIPPHLPAYGLPHGFATALGILTTRACRRR